MEPFVGQISIVGFDFAPKNWALCNGQILPINQNQALFSLLGNTYGGDGRTTFALPDLRGRAAISASANNPLGTSAGTEAVALTPAQMPSHSHTVGASTATPTVGPTGALWATPASGNQYAATSNGTMAAAAISAAGGSQPHDNMQPTTVMNFVIALQGIYPSRS